MLKLRSAARVLPLVALIGFAIGIQPASAAGTVSVGANVDVSRRAGNEAETTISVNPTDPKNIAIVSNIQFGDGLFEASSFDGGLTWNRQIVANGDNLGHSCCDPSLGFDTYGNLFLTWLDTQSSGVKNVMMALSTDGGRSFRFLQIVDRVDDGAIKQPEKPGGGPSVDQPTITTGPGSVWVDVKKFDKKQLIVAAGAKVTGLGHSEASPRPRAFPAPAMAASATSSWARRAR